MRNKKLQLQFAGELNVLIRSYLYVLQPTNMIFNDIQSVNLSQTCLHHVLPEF